VSVTTKVAYLLCLVLTPAGGDSGAERIVEKAVQAAGGAARLAALEASTWAGEGMIYLSGSKVHFKGEWAMAGKDKGRAALTLEMLGQKSTVVVVLNGVKG
jgi:hypothetical protein